MENKAGQFLDDKESLREIVALLGEAGSREYYSYEGLTLEAGFQDRKMVVYTLEDDRPTNIETLTLGSITLDEHKGPFVTFEHRGISSKFGVVPMRVKDREIFVHVPQNFIFKWRGKVVRGGIQYAALYAVLVKTRSREHLRVEGHTYMVTLNKFRERFPEVPLRY